MAAPSPWTVAIHPLLSSYKLAALRRLRRLTCCTVPLYHWVVNTHWSECKGTFQASPSWVSLSVVDLRGLYWWKVPSGRGTDGCLEPLGLLDSLVSSLFLSLSFFYILFFPRYKSNNMFIIGNEKNIEKCKEKNSIIFSLAAQRECLLFWWKGFLPYLWILSKRPYISIVFHL